MRFKPLVTEEEVLRAEADIEAAARSVREEVPADAPPEDFPAAVEADVRPEIRTSIREPGPWPRLLAALGFARRLRRITLENRIARTVDHACRAGLLDSRLPSGRPAFELVAAMYAMSCDPRTPDDELPVILGWLQGVAAVCCPGVTPSALRVL